MAGEVLLYVKHYKPTNKSQSITFSSFLVEKNKDFFQFSSELSNSITKEFKNHVLCKHGEQFCNTGSKLLIAQVMQLLGTVICLVLDTLLSPGDWHKPVHRKFMVLSRRQERNVFPKRFSLHLKIS